MKLIKGFDCIQKEIYGNGTEKILSNKIVKIQTELIRPSLIFKNKANKVIDLNSIKQFTYSKQLRSNALYPDEYFSANELKFLSEIYAFSVVESNRHKGFFHSKLSINPLYTSPGTIEFIEYQDKEYLIIKFTRWQHDYQPRGAGEDQLGEDITYIHGIWEDPLLTDEIIKKIKAQ